MGPPREFQRMIPRKLLRKIASSNDLLVGVGNPRGAQHNSSPTTDRRLSHRLQSSALLLQ